MISCQNLPQALIFFKKDNIYYLSYTDGLCNNGDTAVFHLALDITDKVLKDDLGPFH